MSDVARKRDLYRRELPQRLDEVFEANPSLVDHRGQFPWVLACLGDPLASVWFIAENPSLTQVERAPDTSPENQWNVSPGDKLFREQLVRHGFKEGSVDSPGGWRCYITDVVKSVDRVNAWNKLPQSDRRKVAEMWAPVLRWELELGRPAIVVAVGEKADRLLDHLLGGGMIPPLPRRMKIDHYSYLGSRPDARTGLGPRHPQRVAAWSEQFASVAAAAGKRVVEPPGRPSPTATPTDREERRPMPTPRQPTRSDSAEVPEFVRDGIRAGLTPDQIYARNGKRRAIYLAAIIEEARQQGELASLEPTPANVERLRDRHEHRWERIAARVFGDPRRMREAKDLYDKAKGRAGAAQESYTGRGRRFPKMTE